MSLMKPLLHWLLALACSVSAFAANTFDIRSHGPRGDGATALEFFAGEKELHPEVVRREEVEAHDGACRGSH